MPPVVASDISTTTKARNNPFATAKLEALAYSFENTLDNWATFMERLSSLNYCGALVGPEGVGKTTLLFELKSKLAQKGFKPELIRLSGGKRFIPLSFFFAPCDKNRIVLVDSAENLPYFQFQLLKLKCRLHSLGLIVTAHKEGLLPTLIRCQTSLELFCELTEKLLGAQIEKQILVEAYERSNGNIRIAFMDLYSKH